MHRALLLSLGLACVVPMTTFAQTRPSASQAPTDLILAVDARRTSASGTSSAGDHGDTTFESFTYSPTADLCGLGTGNSEPERTPWVGWHFKADVLGSSVGAAGPELNVRIAWERRWENGARTSSGPRGTNTVTMRGGDVLVLDRVTGLDGRCGGELRLEASVMSASARTRNMRGVSVGGRGGRGMGTAGAGAVGVGAASGTASGAQTGVAGGRGGGRGGGGGTGVAGGGASGTGTQAGAGAGRGTTTMTGRGGGRGSAGGSVAGGGATQSGSTQRPTTGQTRGGGAGATAGIDQTAVSGRGGRGSGAAGGGASGRGSARELYDLLSTRGATHSAEVWLIHRTPDNVEHVQQQTIQFGRANRDFSFPPVAVNTPRGVVMVDINGALRIAESRVTIGLSRRARSSSLQPALDTTGSSEMTFDMPKPEDVLSFEFPALQKPAEDLLAKHKFSVRVRLR